MVLIMCSASSHQKFDILETPSINFDWRQHQTKSVVINPVTQSIHDTTSWWKKGSTFCWWTTLAFHTWLFYFNFYGFKRRTSCNEVSLRCCILLLKWRISVFYFHQELRRQKHKLNYITKGGGCSRIMDFMIDGVYVICLCIVTTLLTSLQHWSPYNHEAIEAHSQTTDPETDWFRPAQRCRQRKWKSCIIDLWNSNTGMSPSYMQPEENYRKHKQALWRGQTS